MIKNMLKMLMRMSIISVLLYCSHYVYSFYTYRAIQMMDFEKILINLIIHSLIFFLIGIILKFDVKLIKWAVQKWAVL